MDERKGRIEKGGVSEVGGDGLRVPLHAGSTGWAGQAINCCCKQWCQQYFTTPTLLMLDECGRKDSKTWPCACQWLY